MTTTLSNSSRLTGAGATPDANVRPAPPSSSMNSIEVKYRNGKCRVNRFRGSQAMLQQVLDAITPALIQVRGCYKWVIIGQPGHYYVEAQYKGGTFTESSGDTPGQAIQNFESARSILVRDHGFQP